MKLAIVCATGSRPPKLMRYYGSDMNFNPLNGIKDGEP